MVIDQEQEYLEYIRKHRANVKTAFYAWKEKSVMGNVLFNEEESINLEKQIDMHDLSKYSDAEFTAYRKKFFPKSPEEVFEDFEFEKAVAHHYNSNPHHWQWWVIPKVENVCIPIPTIYIIEMLCDWTAMSFQKGGSVVEWFESELPKMLLHEKTKETIRSLILEFEEALQEMRKL